MIIPRREELLMRPNCVHTFVTWLIIASPLWWIGGCSSTRLAGNLVAEDPNNSIEVRTKSRCTYELSTWKLDERGNIAGEGMQVFTRGVSGGNLLATHFRGVIAPDSVATVLITEPDGGATAMTMVMLVGIPIMLIAIALGQFHLEAKF
jgi:hypothetical protein